MILNFILLIILPIILAYVGSFLEYTVDKGTDLDDWYRTPTRMLIFMFFLIATLLSITAGIYRLLESYNIIPNA